MSNKVKFDGEEGSIELERITAKKNFASSMQSHKMGATYMFDTLHKYLGEEVYPDLPNEVNGNVAVKQLPVYAFLKTKIEGTEQYNYKYIGNFTVGADKGDKGFFGINNEAVKNTAIRLEGTDHIKGAGYNYPWEVNGVKNIRYNDEKEALCIVTGSDRTAWSAVLEQSHCGNKKSEADIEAYLEQEFKPAYDCAYHANPLIVGVSMTLDEINADIEAFKKLRRTTDDRPYSYCEFWIDGEYDLYYLNLERNRYEKNGVNLYSELSASERTLVDNATSLDEKNQVFINFRINRFQNEAPKYWHITDGLLRLSFNFVIGASDNGEKNNYTYKMTPLAEGGRWRQYEDDVDSIFESDNQAQDTKPYFIELHDFTDDTKNAYVFKGEDNAYYQALELAFPDRFSQMGRDILQAMYNLSPKGTKTLDKLMGFFDEFFFSRAQEYFAKSAYNNDAEYAYEEAWNNKDYVASVDIHPLAQSLGDHYSTERAWIEKRMLYLMSKFGFGGYSSYEDSALGIISVRTQDPQGFTLTPAIDSFPTILGGQAQTSKAERRIKAGEAIKLAAVGGGNTNTYIVGADWLSDIGDLKDLSIDPSSVVVLSVASKRLRRLKVGDENAEEVTSYLATLSVQQCDSMETVDARNLKTLVGTVDLSKCPRLIEALFGGTNATGVVIAAGSKIEHLQLPDSVTAIDLRDTKFLDNFEYGTLANLGFLRLENVPSLNIFAILKASFDADAPLTNIRLVGFDYDGDANDVTMLAELANGNYAGIDVNGIPNPNILPVIEGTININGSVYEDDVEVLKNAYGNALTINATGGYYIKFADPEVLRVLLEKITTDDGIGLTKGDVEGVTNIGTWFQNNTTITSFDEFERFSGVSGLSNDAFDSTSIRTIKLPNITSLPLRAFRYCASLESVGGYEKVTVLNDCCFQGCTKLKLDLGKMNLSALNGHNIFYNCANVSGVVNMTSLNITSLNSGIFAGTGITKVESVGTLVQSVGGECFSGCSQLETVNLPAKTKTIGDKAFKSCSALTTINLENVTSLRSEAFMDCVTLESVDISNVTVLGSRIFKNCTSLKSIGELNQAITSLQGETFYNCALEIEEVNLPNLTTFGGNAFYGCKVTKFTNLGKITTVPTSLYAQGWGDYNSLEEVNIPDTVTKLTGYTFAGYKNVKYIRANNITQIKQGDISDCVNLRESPFTESLITFDSGFPNSPYINFVHYPLVQSGLGYAWARYNTGMRVVILPSLLDLSGWQAFGSTIATHLYLRDVTNIGNQWGGAFAVIVVDNESPATLAANGMPSTATIYVPDSALQTYATATNWSAIYDKGRIVGISQLQTDDPEFYGILKGTAEGYEDMAKWGYLAGY